MSPLGLINAKLKLTVSPDGNKLDGDGIQTGWFSTEHNRWMPVTFTRKCPDECKKLLQSPAADLTQKWKSLVHVKGPMDSQESEAVQRFLQNPAGKQLLNEVFDFFTGRSQGRGSPLSQRIELQFTTHVPNPVEAGDFRPETALPEWDDMQDPETWDNLRYDVSILKQGDSSPLNTSTNPESRRYFPTPDSHFVDYTFSDGASNMAATIDHELLHIWFVNSDMKRTFPTGHGKNPADANEYETTFQDRLTEFYKQMDKLERCIKECQPGRDKSR